MYTTISIILVAIVSFIGGVYFEKANSVSKVKPIKKAFRSINIDRTIVVDRTAK